MIETPDVGLPQQPDVANDLPSFDDYWQSSLMELGFRQNEYGEFVFGDEDLYAPQAQGDDDDGQPQRPAFDPALYRTVVSGMVDRVLQTYGEDIAQDKVLRDAVVAFLAAQPPQNLNDASVRLLVLAGLGLKSLRQREYEAQLRQRKVQSDPKSALNPNFRSGAERLAQQLGLDPDDLITEYIQEWHRSQGGGR